MTIRDAAALLRLVEPKLDFAIGAATAFSKLDDMGFSKVNQQTMRGLAQYLADIELEIMTIRENCEEKPQH